MSSGASPPAAQPITFLMAARRLRDKGVEEFVAAAHRAKHTFPKTQFQLLGAR